MKNTVFKNCTGLDAEGHLSTARDIAIMSAELLRHPEIKNYSTVWMDSLRGGKTELTNTNRLVRFYKGCTGLKTGSTDGAGCCLSASAERRKLLDYGFANFALVKMTPPEEYLAPIPVAHGTAETVQPICEEPAAFLLKKGQEAGVEQSVYLPEKLEAPVKAGDVIGRVTVTLSGGEIGGYDIVAADVPRMGLFEALKKLLLEAIRTAE